jgi:hypothetical protein
VYDVAVLADAVSVALELTQIAVGDTLAVTVGSAFTLTVAAAVELQPLAVPVTVYDWFAATVGVDTTLAPVVVFRYVEGDQAYVVPTIVEDAVSVALEPTQMAVGDTLAVTVG